MNKRALYRRYGHAEGVTPVIFRVFKPRTIKLPGGTEHEPGGDVIALFPGTRGSTADPYSIESYQHAGGHGSADTGLVRDTRAATPSEYASIKRTLENMGYKLRVLKRMPAGSKKYGAR